MVTSVDVDAESNELSGERKQPAGLFAPLAIGECADFVQRIGARRGVRGGRIEGSQQLRRNGQQLLCDHMLDSAVQSAVFIVAVLFEFGVFL